VKALTAWTVLATLAMGGLAAGAHAQEAPAEPTPAPAPPATKRTYAVRPTTAAIDVDGDLTEGPWQEPPTLTLDYETFPADNAPPPVQTAMWITYDARNLYVAVKAQDPDPSKIRARLRDRDAAFQDDFVGVVLDTFNDERRAFEFFVNPLGVQMDLFQNDVTGQEDDSWDALWASAGKLTAEGYQVEMAIPFSSLRFPRSATPQIWGIDALRIWPRDERRRIGAVALPRGRICYLCHEAKLDAIGGVVPGRNMEIDPTLTGRATDERPASDDDYERDSKVDPGVTARWGVTPGITLNATINPDFSQIEADAAQLDVNTQFSLFYPEKRPFFLEGADIFDTKLQTVYTRTIADPDWGFKVTGKTGSNAFGFISARDTVTNFVIPGSQSSRFTSIDEENTSTILRFRHDLSSGNASSVGSLVTDREGSDYHNRVLGGDILRRWGSDAVRIEALGSSTRYPLALARAFGQDTDELRGYGLRAAYQHMTRAWQGYALYTDFSEDYRADLGFLPQVGIHKFYGLVEKYRYWDDGSRWWSRRTMGVETTINYDYDGNPLQRQVGPYMFWGGKRQSELNLYVGLGPSYYRGKLFDRYFLQSYGAMQITPTLYASLESRVGQEIDVANVRQGRIARFIPRLRFEPGRHLRLDLNHFDEALRVDGGRLYRVSLTELRATYQIDVRTFVRLITQYEQRSNDPALFTFPVDRKSRSLFNQLLFSYKLNPQTVLFAGYSDDSAGSGPSSPDLRRSDRTVFVKLGYAFVL
jgi:hypothetical protein